MKVHQQDKWYTCNAVIEMTVQAHGDFVCLQILLQVVSRHHWHPNQIHTNPDQTSTVSKWHESGLEWFRLPKCTINFNRAFKIDETSSQAEGANLIRYDIILWAFRNHPSGLPHPTTNISGPSCERTSGRQLSHHSILSCSVAVRHKLFQV